MPFTVTVTVAVWSTAEAIPTRVAPVTPWLFVVAT